MLLIILGFTALILSLHYAFPASADTIKDADKAPIIISCPMIYPVREIPVPVSSSPKPKSNSSFTPAITNDTISFRDTLQEISSSASNTKPGSENGVAGGTTDNGNGIEKGTGSSEILRPDTMVIAEDRDPEFIGGAEAMAVFIGRHLRYPPKAENMGMEGEVHISFIVEEDGSISNITVMRGLTIKECNEEAVRVISKMPKWKPAVFMGKPTRTRMKIPIRYELPED
jgi:protein TonB